MSNPILEPTDGTKTVQFSTMWKAMAAASFVMLSFISMMVLTWGFWVTNSIFTHGDAITVLKERSTNGSTPNRIHPNAAGRTMIANLAQTSISSLL